MRGWGALPGCQRDRDAISVLCLRAWSTPGAGQRPRDGTIYIYFSSKTEILLGILTRLNESTEREQQFTLGSEQDMRTFFLTYIRQRMSLLWPNAEVFRAVLPEMLVNADLRDLYYQQVLIPTFKIAEHYFQLQSTTGQMHQIDIPLAVRTLAATVIGLLTIQLLGDETLAKRWEELPEVLTTVLIDGLKSSTREEEDTPGVIFNSK